MAGIFDVLSFEKKSLLSPQWFFLPFMKKFHGCNNHVLISYISFVFLPSSVQFCCKYSFLEKNDSETIYSQLFFVNLHRIRNKSVCWYNR